jgi:hypothetical protein
MVMSPLRAGSPCLGVYCLTCSKRASSWEVAVARGYSRMCDAWMVCSWMSKTEDDGDELEAIVSVCSFSMQNSVLFHMGMNTAVWVT